MAPVNVKNIRDLVGRIVWVRTNTTSYSYPRFGKSLEDAWKELRINIEGLRRQLGDARTDQVLDMCSHAQQHFRDAYEKSPERSSKPGMAGFEDLKLGSNLMQDVEWVVRGREPFAYPK